MSKFTFYFQTRYDGGTRSGIGSEGNTELHHFSPGLGEHNPALLWYIDITCENESMSSDPESFRRWLLEHKDYFTEILTDIADNQLRLGFDNELQPIQREYSDAPDRTRVQISISAIRRIVARDIARRLKEFISSWEALLQQLTPLAVA